MEDDAQNELKRRARRRLVGAIALALAAVIVLPMVMDHEPRIPAQDIQVRIPSQDGDKSIASRILPGKGPTPLPAAVDSKAAAPAPTVAEPTAPAKAETVAEAKPEPKPVTKPEAKPEPKPVVAPAKGEAKPAETKPAEKKAEAEGARAAAALSGQGSGSEQWVVQLGAYKEAGNVKLLVKKLKEMGVPSYTEQFDSPQGPRMRVRAGPFATKDEAEKAQAKAKTIGVSGPVAPK